jgi:hypothetical protein
MGVADNARHYGYVHGQSDGNMMDERLSGLGEGDIRVDWKQ